MEPCKKQNPGTEDLYRAKEEKMKDFYGNVEEIEFSVNGVTVHTKDGQSVNFPKGSLVGSSTDEISESGEGVSVRGIFQNDLLFYPSEDPRGDYEVKISGDIDVPPEVRHLIKKEDFLKMADLMEETAKKLREEYG